MASVDKQPWCVIVDDNPVNTMLLEQALLLQGVKVTVINNPLIVEQVIDDSGLMPQLVILDQCMPELAGHQLANNLRRRLGSGCRCYAWTAVVLSESQQSAFDGQLHKPYSPKQLELLLQSL
ncbi:response regulator [Ferrimonas senticii]|uniref:response regulator n=1 Tax=Ferrimonas senticii TaxID=394566 RepID=UPI0003FD36E0|nr:response regulator [Ferrimonas senticii]